MLKARNQNSTCAMCCNPTPTEVYKHLPGFVKLLCDISSKQISTFNSKTASYSLVLADGANKIVEINSTTPTTLTVPNDSTVLYPIGTSITVAQFNTGQITIAGADGVTILSNNSLFKTSSQYALATIIKRASNQWYLSGDLLL